MILGLDISTSITGVTVLDDDGNIVENAAWDTRNKNHYKDLFDKANHIRLELLKIGCYHKIKKIYIEQSLQSFRSGFSSAQTLSTLSRFNGIVSWLCYKNFGIKPEYLAAVSARKLVGISVPRGTKAKECVIKYVIDNAPDVSIAYTKHGNVKPDCYDKADSWVIARAGYLQCSKQS
mgnify:CR=1 FL=1